VIEKTVDLSASRRKVTMTKTLFAIGLYAAVSSFGQGTVFFANDSATLSSPPDRLIRFEGVPMTGTNYVVQLYYGPTTATPSALIPVTSAPARLRASTTTLPGVWAAGGDRTLSGFNFGQTVLLQVRLWDIYYAPSYEAAQATGLGIYGTSSVFLYDIPASSANPPSDFYMQNFTGMQLFFIPEPSVLSLLGLCAAMGALLGFRKRR
jgi:hypothetical protein